MKRNHLLQSPLSRIKGLQEVPPEKIAAIEKYFKATYVRGMTEYQREARRRAEAVRDKILQ
jgi:hypothetical protein